MSVDLIKQYREKATILLGYQPKLVECRDSLVAHDWNVGMAVAALALESPISIEEWALKAHPLLSKDIRTHLDALYGENEVNEMAWRCIMVSIRDRQ
jgi:hypothetical protein